MCDPWIIISSLRNIENCLQDVLDWTAEVDSTDDFTHSPHGVMLLNAVCMKLIAVGEEVKSIDKRTNKLLLAEYPEIFWKDIMGLRDVIAHRYFQIDAEKIFTTVKEDIPKLTDAVRRIRYNLENKRN